MNWNVSVIRLNVFRGLLVFFQKFIKAFQTEKPLIHTLHRRMVAVTRELFGMFKKTEYIGQCFGQLDVTHRTIRKS
jgi:hypothetical protein